VGYVAPDATFDYHATNALTKQIAGYELMGYWSFFSEEGADKLIETHVCLSCQNTYASDLYDCSGTRSIA
jgi:hypothetical protein